MPLMSYINHDLTFKYQNTCKYTVNSYRATAKTCPAQAANFMKIAIQSTYIFWYWPSAPPSILSKLSTSLIYTSHLNSAFFRGNVHRTKASRDNFVWTNLSSGIPLLKARFPGIPLKAVLNLFHLDTDLDPQIRFVNNGSMENIQTFFQSKI